MEAIAVGFDGSAAAEAALDWIVTRAFRHPLRVDLIGVANLFPGDRKSMGESLDAAESRLRTRVPGLPTESHLVDGLVPGALIDSAYDADLLVIGVTLGHPVRSAVHGWLPLRVAARAETATCVVPSGWQPVEGPVVGAVDDDGSETAVAFAAREASESGSPLRLIHSWRIEAPGATGGPDFVSVVKARGEHTELLRRAVHQADAEHPGLRIETELSDAEPADALKSSAIGASLVVLGSHRRSLITGGLLGSVTQAVLGEVPAPVCIVPDHPTPDRD